LTIGKVNKLLPATPTKLVLTTGQIPLATSVGQSTTLVVKGDVYIAPGGTNTLNYAAATSLANIPSFKVIASGNIYVDANVTQLDGQYIAQGGNFITCAQNVAGNYGLSGVGAIGTCNKQLKIYGFVAAGKAVVPNRTLGDFAGAAGQVETPGEFFYYNPQMWLTGGSTSGGGVGSWQAVTSLPPIL
jgi:hypothetical protein